MKISILIFTLGLSLSATAQTFYFPQSQYADSAALARSMPVLAQQLITVYKNADKYTYWDNLFHFQMVAEQYLPAKASIDSLRQLRKTANFDRANAIALQFESYLQTKELQKTDNRPFDELLVATLGKLYHQLPEKARSSAESYFDADMASLKNNLQTQLSDLKKRGRDSIDLRDARALCKAYNNWNVYNHVHAIGQKLMAAEDDKKYIILDSILISTKAGGQLSAIVVRKKDTTAPLPAVVVYNIYAGSSDKRVAKNAALRGFVGVVVNTRGKFLSPQTIEPFEHDAEDAWDMIDWISTQPWCNGKVGMYGGSYLGFSQWSAVKKMHPALKTIVPQVAVGAGIDFPFRNGIIGTYSLPWIHYVTNNKLTDYTDFTDSKKWYNAGKTWYVSGKSFRSFDSIEGRPNAIFQRWLNHPSYDSFWHKMVPYKEEFSHITIPVLTTTGYFEGDQRGALYYFDQHHQYNKKANHYLLIGPYDHAGAQSAPLAEVMGYKIDPVANVNITDIVFQWFNHILKDSARPSLLKDKINYQVMGTNEWKHAPSLSQMNNDTLTFYLSNVRTKSHYQLQKAKPSAREYIAQEISYTDRSDSVDTKNYLILDSVLEANTDDNLSFISEPLDTSIIINGSFTGSIKATFNKKDMDINVDLYELQPDGKYFALAGHVFRASYAKNRSKRQLLQPGKEETIPVHNTYFTSKQLSKGSRIILVICMNKTPYWQINYGTGKDVSDETIQDGQVPMKIKWSNASYIQLPVYR